MADYYNPSGHPPGSGQNSYAPPPRPQQYEGGQEYGSPAPQVRLLPGTFFFPPWVVTDRPCRVHMATARREKTSTTTPRVHPECR
jgi:hypothetical protein